MKKIAILTSVLALAACGGGMSDKVISRSDDLSSRPSWVKDDNPVVVKDGDMFITSMATVRSDRANISQGYRIAENQAKTDLSNAIKTDIKANLKTSGETYGALLKNMNGNLIVILDKSKIQTGKFEFLYSNLISQVLQTLKMYQPKEGRATINCAVIRSDIKNGVAYFPNGIALDSLAVEGFSCYVHQGHFL